MTIGIPQTTLLVVYLFATAFAVANHGKNKKKGNFYVSGTVFLLELSILNFGGFFAEFWTLCIAQRRAAHGFPGI